MHEVSRSWAFTAAPTGRAERGRSRWGAQRRAYCCSRLPSYSLTCDYNRTRDTAARRPRVAWEYFQHPCERSMMACGWDCLACAAPPDGEPMGHPWPPFTTPGPRAAAELCAQGGAAAITAASTRRGAAETLRCCCCWLYRTTCLLALRPACCGTAPPHPLPHMPAADVGLTSTCSRLYSLYSTARPA